jgi:cytochrome c biogenesis protein ResB
MDGTSAWLPYEIQLSRFNVETYDNGVPSMFEADLLIDGEEISLRVNEPYSRSFGEDIYLTGYDSMAGSDSQYCIIQVVREPWKYSALVGVIMMLAGAFLLFAGGPQRRYGEDD